VALLGVGMSGVSYVSIGNIIIDDIVLPDGVTHMGVLGGGGTHAVAGMRIWTHKVGFVAAVGPDLSPECQESLQANKIDLSGVLVREKYQTARAWQIFEWDERRIEIFRTDFDDFIRMTPKLRELPDNYWLAKGYHVLSDAREGPAEIARAISQKGNARLFWEPPPLIVTPEGRDMAQEVLPLVDIFSPNLREATALCETDDINDILEKLASWGAKVVALRMGIRGSIVRQRNGSTVHVPIVPTEVVDVTGAGNAYCGGFLVGYGETGDIRTAAMYGAVSASFAIEQFGIPIITAETQQEARRRLAALEQRVSRRAKSVASGG
jgi:sugar/nucleoside kinase (ribokinase family)